MVERQIPKSIQMNIGTNPLFKSRAEEILGKITQDSVEHIDANELWIKMKQGLNLAN